MLCRHSSKEPQALSGTVFPEGYAENVRPRKENSVESSASELPTSSDLPTNTLDGTNKLEDASFGNATYSAGSVNQKEWTDGHASPAQPYRDLPDVGDFAVGRYTTPSTSGAPNGRVGSPNSKMLDFTQLEVTSFEGTSNSEETSIETETQKTEEKPSQSSLQAKLEQARQERVSRGSSMGIIHSGQNLGPTFEELLTQDVEARKDRKRMLDDDDESDRFRHPPVKKLNSTSSENEKIKVGEQEIKLTDLRARLNKEPKRPIRKSNDYELKRSGP